MKDKAKRIFALSGVFICILVLLSNIIFTVASATQIDMKNHVNILYNAAKNSHPEIANYANFAIFYKDNGTYDIIQIVAYNDTEIKSYENGVITFANSNYWILKAEGSPLKMREDGLLVCNNSTYGNGSNNQYKVIFTDSFIFTNDYNTWKTLTTLNDYNVAGGIPLNMNDITFEHYYNKLSDLSHDITITNSSSKDIYYTLRCIMPQNMVAANSYEHLMYMYKEKQEYNGITSIKYNQLDNASAKTASEWISQYFTSQSVLSEFNLTQNEIYNNLMSDTTFWHRSNIYTSGTVGLPYMTAFNISQSEMGAESEHNAIIETLNNNVVNASYTVDGYSNGNVYENSSVIKLSAGEIKNINIPQNYMSLNNGVFYQWVLSVGETDEEITEHSRKGFTATTSNVGIIPPENIGSDKYVYDEQGNIIGEFDGNGNIVIFDNNNNTPSLDVPQFDTTSFKGIVSSVGEVVQMSYKMLPPEVYAIIAFGLGVVLAIGIIRLVTG